MKGKNLDATGMGSNRYKEIGEIWRQPPSLAGRTHYQPRKGRSKRDLVCVEEKADLFLRRFWETNVEGEQRGMEREGGDKK